MAVEKITFAGFQTRLKSGGYVNIGGARRSVTKSDLSKAQKEECRALIDKHYGAKAKAPKEKAPKRAARKGAKVKAAKTPKQVAKKEKAPKAAPAVVKADPTKVKSKPGRKPGSGKAKAVATGDYETVLARTRDAAGIYAGVVETLRKCKSECPAFNAEPGITKVGADLTKLIESLDAMIVQPLLNPSESEVRGAEMFQRAAAGAVTPDNGGQVPTRIPLPGQPGAYAVPVTQ